jgi:hypothetical protein
MEQVESCQPDRELQVRGGSSGFGLPVFCALENWSRGTAPDGRSAAGKAQVTGSARPTTKSVIRTERRPVP